MSLARTHTLPLSQSDKTLLLNLARDSITYYQESHDELQIDSANYPPNVQQRAACFVTLYLRKELRGCIGTTEAYQPLAKDVAHNAYCAAFRDPRFPQLLPEEIPQLRIQVSVLTAPQPISFVDEKTLLGSLRPKADGLIITEGARKATFLPTVWDKLPDRQDFLSQLKIKAGLSPDHWSDRIEAWRYQTIVFGDE